MVHIEGHYLDRIPHVKVKDVESEKAMGLVKVIGELMHKELKKRAKRGVFYWGRHSEVDNRFSIVKEVNGSPKAAGSIEYTKDGVCISLRDLEGQERDAFLERYAKQFIELYGN